MDTNIITKSHLENEVQRGIFKLSFENANLYWQTEENLEVIRDLVQEILGKFSDVERQFISYLLRAIIFTGDFKETLDFWSKQLERNISFTDTEVGGVGAKILSWGEDIETRHTIIVVNGYGVTLSISQNNLDFYSTIKRLLAHEFTHVLTQFRSENAQKELVNNNYQAVFFHLADTFWGEMQAETIAHSLVTDDPLEPHLTLCIEFIERGEKIIKQAIHDFRFSNDMQNLFHISLKELSIIIAQIGRCLGVISGKNLNKTSPDNELQDFIDRLEKISPLWGDASSKICEVIGASKGGIELYKNISEQITGYFHAVGLFPECTEDGLIYVKVP